MRSADSSAWLLPPHDEPPLGGEADPGCPHLAGSAATEKWLSVQPNHSTDAPVPTTSAPDRPSLVWPVILVKVSRSIGTRYPFHPTANRKGARRVRNY